MRSAAIGFVIAMAVIVLLFALSGCARADVTINRPDVRLTGICPGYKIYRLRSNDVVVMCPDSLQPQLTIRGLCRPNVKVEKTTDTLGTRWHFWC